MTPSNSAQRRRRVTCSVSIAALGFGLTLGSAGLASADKVVDYNACVDRYKSTVLLAPELTLVGASEANCCNEVAGAANYDPAGGYSGCQIDLGPQAAPVTIPAAGPAPVFAEEPLPSYNMQPPSSTYSPTPCLVAYC